MSAPCTMACIKRPCVSTRICRFFPLIFLPASKPCGSTQCPFFRRLNALAVKDRGGWTGCPTRLLAALHIERFVKAIERAVIAPQVEIIVECRARRQVLRDRSPLASRAQNIHQPVDHFALINMASVATASGRRDHRRHMSPLGIRQIARIPQSAAVIPRPIFVRPHRAPPSNQGEPSEFTTDSTEPNCLRTDTQKLLELPLALRRDMP